MDRFYTRGDSRALSEARQHMAALFGLAVRMRMHISLGAEGGSAPEAPKRNRPDPRLKAV
jgi:hypothetical protein